MQPDLIPLLVSLVKNNQWKNIYYIYNHQDGFGFFIFISRNIFLLYFILAISRVEGLFEYQLKENDFTTKLEPRNLDLDSDFKDFFK